MNTRGYLKDLHVGLGEHHAEKAAHHSRMAGHFRDLANRLEKTNLEGEYGEFGGALAKIADEHDSASKHHVELGEAHAAKARELADAAKAADFEDGLSKRELAPLPAGFQAIPRHGQPEINLTRADLPEDFLKLLSIED